MIYTEPQYKAILERIEELLLVRVVIDTTRRKVLDFYIFIHNFCAKALKNKSMCSFLIVKGGNIRIRLGFLELPVNKK